MRRDLIWPKGTLLCLGLIITTAAGCRSASKVPGLGWLDRGGYGVESALTSASTPNLPPPSATAAPSGTSLQTGLGQTQTAQVSPAYRDTGLPAATPISYQQGAYDRGSQTAATPSTGSQGGGPNGFYGTEYPGSQAEQSSYAASPSGAARDGYRTADVSAASAYSSGSQDSGNNYSNPATQLSPTRTGGYTSGSSAYSPANGSTPYGTQPTGGPSYGAPASGNSTYGTQPPAGSNYGTPSSSGSSNDSGSYWGGYGTGATNSSPANSSTGTASSDAGSTQPAIYPRPAEPFRPGTTGDFPTGGSSSSTDDSSRTIPAGYQQQPTTSGYDYTG